jgi:hypothetical protein
LSGRPSGALSGAPEESFAPLTRRGWVDRMKRAMTPENEVVLMPSREEQE